MERVADARNSVTPFSRNGGPSVTCSVHATGRSVAGKVLDRFNDSNGRSFEADSPLDAEPCFGERRAGLQTTWSHDEVVGHERCFAVWPKPGCLLFRRGAAKQIETQVVSHDAGQQLRFAARAVDAVGRGT